MELSQVGQELYDLLYVDKGNEIHPLEKYIFAIDNSLDNNNLLRSIGERIGIYIGENEEAAVELPLRLKMYLENEKNIQETERKMEMTPDEYENYLPHKYKNLPREEFLPLYSNRLLNF
jgi:hypothetical protein